MDLKVFFSNNKGSISFAVAVILIGSLAYFLLGGGSGASSMASSPQITTILSNVRIKAFVTEGGDLNLFALANETLLSKIKVSEGESTPKPTLIVLGSSEAKTMRNEKLFTNTGDRIKNFFGIDEISVRGVLSETKSLVDDLHFLSADDFAKINGEEDKMFIKVEGGSTELLYRLDSANESITKKFKFEEGGLEFYQPKVLGGKTYYPIILGSDEAKAMREEKEFAKSGDIIHDFLGKDFFVAGVLLKTNSPIDVMHIIPVKKQDLD